MASVTSKDSKDLSSRGNDTVIFIILVTLPLMIFSPIIVSAYSLYDAYSDGEYLRLASAIVGLILLYIPLYVFNRYQTELIPKFFRFLRGWASPFLLPYGWLPEPVATISNPLTTCPNANGDGTCSNGALVAAEMDTLTFLLNNKLVKVFVIGMTFKILLGMYRMMCKPPSFKDDKRYVGRQSKDFQGSAMSASDSDFDDAGKHPSLRVLLVSDSFPPKVDGVSTFAEKTVEHLQSFGHIVHIITSVKGPDRLRGARVYRLPGLSTIASVGHSVSMPLPSILYFFTQFKPDAVQLLEVSPLAFAMLLYCQIADIPVSLSHHTRLDLYVNVVTPQFPTWVNEAILTSLEVMWYPIADAHPCVCNALVERIKKRRGSNVNFWITGVSSKFSPEHKSEEWRDRATQGKPELPLILHFGRLAPEKNSELISDIVKKTIQLMGGEDKVRFLIVGDGPSKKILEEELPKSCVYFAGILRGAPLLQCVASSDVFFSPSYTETFPLVFLEAMSSRVSVVGPNSGGTPDTFSDGVEGFYYSPPNNSTMAAEKIVQAIKEGDSMRERAYQHGKTFSWSRSIHDLEDMLIDLVDLKERSETSKIL